MKKYRLSIISEYKESDLREVAPAIFEGTTESQQEQSIQNFMHEELLEQMQNGDAIYPEFEVLES